MKTSRILLDTNLLILFVVGTASRQYIGKHKKLTAFTVEDYGELVRIIATATEVLVTPNTLTETSNLAAYIGEPARSEVFHVLRTIINNTQETHLPSRVAANRKEFIRLGLTDAVLIEAGTQDTIVLTTDLDLYLAVMAKGAQAINFNHLRNRYL
ncbi:conserved hypothetical protein [Crenothrix polyspora]|uniref:PIN domain-containing protein n=1 Tax=Crenothrix polyspora TaxID=360316 RepID=A0A1R4H1P7_9GAMM|nr:PIN domain-containing protein [Crenothrix polyspora]SJM90153.1 conserved hypothetical protein [Crenothrix polyspora]